MTGVQTCALPILYDAKNGVSYSVAGTGRVTYNEFGWCEISGPGMLDAARFWFDNPKLNYGWRIENTELNASPTRGSREAKPAFRPYIEITYDLTKGR